MKHLVSKSQVFWVRAIEAERGLEEDVGLPVCVIGNSLLGG